MVFVRKVCIVKILAKTQSNLATPIWNELVQRDLNLDLLNQSGADQKKIFIEHLLKY